MDTDNNKYHLLSVYYMHQKLHAKCYYPHFLNEMLRIDPYRGKFPLSRKCTFPASLHFPSSRGRPHTTHQQPVQVFTMEVRCRQLGPGWPGSDHGSQPGPCSSWLHKLGQVMELPFASVSSAYKMEIRNPPSEGCCEGQRPAHHAHNTIDYCC